MARKERYPDSFNKQPEPELNEAAADYEIAKESKSLLGNLEAIDRTCIKHKVDKLYLVGSAAKGTLTATSDMDFLVQFKDFDLEFYLENFLGLKDSLKAILKREVDLIEQQTVKNPILIRSIDDSKILIYG